MLDIDGLKYYACKKCNGSGYIICPACFGFCNHFRCAGCNGNKVRFCGICYGSGNINKQ